MQARRPKSKQGTCQLAAGEKPNNSAAEARAANERSRALKQEMTARDPFWPVSRALGWIAFRDEARIEQTLRVATWYSVQAGGRYELPTRGGRCCARSKMAVFEHSGRAKTCRAKLGPMRWGGVGRIMFVFVARTCWHCRPPNGSWRKRANVTTMRHPVSA